MSKTHYVIVDPGDYTRADVQGAYATKEEAQKELNYLQKNENWSSYAFIAPIEVDQ